MVELNILLTVKELRLILEALMRTAYFYKRHPNPTEQTLVDIGDCAALLAKLNEQIQRYRQPCND